MIRTVIGWTITFVLVGTAGALSWLVSEENLPDRLLDPGAANVIAHSPLFELFGIPACMIVAGVAGFAFWRGFFLWGLAVALPVPPAAGIVAAHQVSARIWPESAAYGDVVMALIVFFNLLMLCSATSALGAGMRVTLRRLASGPAGSTP